MPVLVEQPAVCLKKTSIVFKQTNITQPQDAMTTLRLGESSDAYVEGSFISGHVVREDSDSYLLYTDDSKLVPTTRVPWAKSTSDLYAVDVPWFPSSSLPVTPNVLTGAVSCIHARLQPLLSSIYHHTSPVLMV